VRLAFKLDEPALYGAHGRNDFIKCLGRFRGQFACFRIAAMAFRRVQLATGIVKSSMQLTSDAAIRSTPKPGGPV